MSLVIELILIGGFFVLYPIFGGLTYRGQQRAIRAGRISRWRLYNEILLAEWAATLLVVGYWILEGLSWRELGLTGPWNRATAIAWVLALVAVGALAAQVLIGRHKDEWRRQVRSQLDAVDGLMPTSRSESLGFTAVAFTAGFCEEVLYRGFLFWWLQHLGLGTIAAAAGTVIFFGAAHLYQGWLGGLRAAAAGVFLIALTVLAGSLWPAIVLHVLGDLVSGWTARVARAEPTPSPA
ncbi:MAG: CPBP family intramembrane glutamic endopeptidase [Acidobacteriota bacterium]